jgi:hypothetical protein
VASFFKRLMLHTVTALHLPSSTPLSWHTFVSSTNGSPTNFSDFTSDSTGSESSFRGTARGSVHIIRRARGTYGGRLSLEVDSEATPYPAAV